MPMVDIDWLKDHVEVPEGLTYEQLAKDLVKVGLEEEEIHTSQVTGPIVVGYVVDATPEPQKNGKIINWCHVDVGDEYNETDENGNKVEVPFKKQPFFDIALSHSLSSAEAAENIYYVALEKMRKWI